MHIRGIFPEYQRANEPYGSASGVAATFPS